MEGCWRQATRGVATSSPVRTPVEISREAGDLPHARCGSSPNARAPGATRRSYRGIDHYGGTRLAPDGPDHPSLVPLHPRSVAQFLPDSFYDSFPTPGHAWVALLPPHNEHLLRDF